MLNGLDILYGYEMTLRLKSNKGLGGLLSSYENLLLFQRTQVPFPTPVWWVTPASNSSSRGFDTLGDWLLLASKGRRHAYGVHNTIRQNTHKHKINKSLQKNVE